MGQKFKIEWSEPGKLIADTQCFGATHTIDSRIEIDGGLTHERERETLIHEILHQMVSHSGLGLDDEEEEKIVSFLGTALHHHITSNPSLWRWVMRPAPGDSHEPPTQPQQHSDGPQK